MYWANWINGGRILAALVLPPSVVNAPTGPTITRVLQARNPDDARPDYALRGMTMAVALEKIYHQELDQMPRVKRARTSRVEWFMTTQPDFENIKLALKAVGQGVFYDLTKHSPRAMPADLVGKGERLVGGVSLATTTHAFRKSPRLLGLTQDEIEEDDGSVRLTLDDIEDVRNLTQRGQQILELITRRGPRKAAETQTDARQTRTIGTEAPLAIAQPRVTTRARSQQTTPAQPTQSITVRLTRSRVAMLREAAQTPDDESRRRRLARALANLG